MAKLRDRITTVTENPVIPTAPENRQQSSTSQDSLQPGLSPFMRSPLPPVKGVSPDALRQFYRGGIFPQRRVLYSDQS